MNRRFFFSVIGVALLCVTVLLKHENDSRRNASDALPDNSATNAEEHLQSNFNSSNNSAVGALPEAPTAIEPAQQLVLWQPQFTETSQAAVRAYQTRVEPALLQQLKVGQTLSFALPEDDSLLNAKLHSTHNQGRFAKVWSGSLAGQPEATLTITQGKIETHLVVVHNGSVYSAIIDNKTGHTVVIDQAEIEEKTIPFEDGIVLPVNDTPLPKI